jgi:hypothetical protein
MTSPLENLCGPGKLLRAEPADAREFEGLKRSGLARLTDAEKPSNSAEYEGDLEINDRIVEDLIAACRAVATGLERFPPQG